MSELLGNINDTQPNGESPTSEEKMESKPQRGRPKGSTNRSLPWKQGGALGQKFNLKDQEQVLIAIQHYTPEGKETWMYREATADAETEVLTVTPVEYYPWKRVTAWIKVSACRPQLKALRGRKTASNG